MPFPLAEFRTIPSPSDLNPIFPGPTPTNPYSHFTLSAPSSDTSQQMQKIKNGQVDMMDFLIWVLRNFTVALGSYFGLMGQSRVEETVNNQKNWGKHAIYLDR